MPTPWLPPAGGGRAKKEDADLRRRLGRSRGGLGTKAHVAVDRRGSLLKLLLTPGQKGDAPQAESLLSDPKHGRVGHVIADAGYDGDATRRRVRLVRARCRIKPNPRRKRKKRLDRDRDRHRNVIERFFCRIKRYRRAATRYEKKAENFAGFIHLAAFITDNGGE